MNGTIYVALGVIFLALAPVYHGRSKTPEDDKPQNGRAVAWVFALAGIAFFVAAAISFITAD